MRLRTAMNTAQSQTTNLYETLWGFLCNLTLQLFKYKFWKWQMWPWEAERLDAPVSSHVWLWWVLMAFCSMDLGEVLGRHKQNTGKERLLTLSKGLLHISPYPSEGVLRGVRWGGAGRCWPDGHGNGPADGVAGGGARGACPLGLQKQDTSLVCFHQKSPYAFSKVSGPML